MLIGPPTSLGEFCTDWPKQHTAWTGQPSVQAAVQALTKEPISYSDGSCLFIVIALYLLKCFPNLLPFN